MKQRTSMKNKRFELNIDYDMVHYAKQSVAIRFTITYTYTGQQNGTTNHLTINYDFQKKPSLDTKDLFLPKTNFFEEIILHYIFGASKKDKTLSKDQTLLQKEQPLLLKTSANLPLKEKYVEFYFPASQVADEDLVRKHLRLKDVAERYNEAGIYE
ncbi:hypothetical protein ACEQPO_25640 [Bacillus sp. SL00103]